MPFLQVDLPGSYPADVKRAFAARLIRLYAETMQTQERIPSVALRELGPDNLLRLNGGELSSPIVVMCDVRRGRPAAQREFLAERIVAECAATFGVEADDVVVEFTQHTPDEMYRYGALAPEWDAAEAQTAKR
ncbi:MAG: hypothetical protein NVSMB64_16530 [Candidatus Velthaea sp.]